MQDRYSFDLMEVPEGINYPAHPALKALSADTKTRITKGERAYVNNCPVTPSAVNVFVRTGLGARPEEIRYYQIPTVLGRASAISWFDFLDFGGLPAGEYLVGLWRPGVPFTFDAEDQDTTTQTAEKFFAKHSPEVGQGHHSVVVLIEE